MKNTVCRLGLTLVLAALADTALAYTDGEKAVAAVGERLRANDCNGAVKALNTGLQAGHKEVALLAGTMFEAGFCVNKNWSKAIGFYTQAYQSGIREGALRLAAGFAAAANGPDTAAALWWGKRAGLAADYCTARLPDTDDPDHFVEALRLWPARDLEICNYVVGELSFVAGDTRYPLGGISRELEGRADVVFLPAIPRWEMGDGGTNGTNRVRLSEALTRTISQAGARYRQPAGMPTTWSIPFIFEVDTDRGRWW